MYSMYREVHAVSSSTLFQTLSTKHARRCMNYAGEWGGSFQIPNASFGGVDGFGRQGIADWDWKESLPRVSI